MASCIVMHILQLLKINIGKGHSATEETESIRKIVKELDTFEPVQAKFIACFAYLLSRIAGADQFISPEETHMMEIIVMERTGLPNEQANVVVQMAKSQNLLFGGTENYIVTREFKEMSNHKERLALLDCLYAIAASHDSISTIEDNEISQIAEELRIEHPDFISVRIAYRNQLAVLK